MSIPIHSESPVNPMTEAAREVARRTAEGFKQGAREAGEVAHDVSGRFEDVADDAEEAAGRASDTVRDVYESAVLKAGDTLAISKEYVRRNPVPVVLGAVAFGAALGYLLIMARRKPTFGERYADEPLAALREALFGAFAPIAHKVHEGYDSARDVAGEAMDRVHGIDPGRTRRAISDQLGRIGNNLKFW